MPTSRDFERRLQDAEADLRYIVGLDADGATRSPFLRASSNLTTWAQKAQPGSSQFTGTRSGGHHDLSGRIADSIDNGRSTGADRFDEDHAKLVKQAIAVIEAVSQLRKKVDAATTTKPKAKEATDDQECRTCAAVGYHNVVYARGLCGWCWGLSQRLGPGADGKPIDPHPELARRHNLGKRVYDKHIALYHPIPTGAPTG